MRIAIADDEPLDLSFLKDYLLSIGHNVVFIAKDGEELCQYCLETSFDVLITDLYMPRINGLDLIHEIRKIKSDLEIIVLSNNGSNYVKNKLLRISNVNFIAKYKENYFEEIGKLLSLKNNNIKSISVSEVLTSNELKIFKVLLTAKTTIEICDHLNISKKNLERYKTSIYGKLEVKNRTDLIARYYYLVSADEN